MAGERTVFPDKADSGIRIYFNKNRVRGKKKIPLMFYDMNEITGKKFGVSFSMGVSEEGTMGEFYLLFMQSKTAVRKKIYTGRASLIFYGEEKNNGEMESHYLIDKKMYENIQREYLNGDLQMAQEILREKFNEIQKHRSCTYTALHDFSVDFINLNRRKNGRNA